MFRRRKPSVLLVFAQTLFTWPFQFKSCLSIRPRYLASSNHWSGSPRFLCRPTAFCSTCWSHWTSERSPYGKQRICRCNYASAHFHVSWISNFIFYPQSLYKSLHQSFFYSFMTILPSESGITLHYSAIFP